MKKLFFLITVCQFFTLSIFSSEVDKQAQLRQKYKDLLDERRSLLLTQDAHDLKMLVSSKGVGVLDNIDLKKIDRADIHNIMLVVLQLSTKVGSRSLDDVTKEKVIKVRSACFKNPLIRRLIGQSYMVSDTWGNKGKNFSGLPDTLMMVYKDDNFSSDFFLSDYQCLLQDKEAKFCLENLSKNKLKTNLPVLFFEKEVESLTLSNAEFPLIATQEVKGKGVGVVARENISKGQFVALWNGDATVRTEEELTDITESDWFLMNNHNMSKGLVDKLAVSKKNITVDPRGIAVFINHSYHPNLKPCVKKDDKSVKLILAAVKDISKGEELTWNYGQQYWEERGIDPIA